MLVWTLALSRELSPALADMEAGAEVEVAALGGRVWGRLERMESLTLRTPLCFAVIAARASWKARRYRARRTVEYAMLSRYRHTGRWGGDLLTTTTASQ